MLPTDACENADLVLQGHVEFFVEAAVEDYSVADAFETA